ncbi:uncharacterized protein [Osmerus mordax]|uniref:uncharacterized protein n=1 Tax=Osmerus mordax TaxID=8014 RepID=UPI00350F3E46
MRIAAQREGDTGKGQEAGASGGRRMASVKAEAGAKAGAREAGETGGGNPLGAAQHPVAGEGGAAIHVVEGTQSSSIHPDSHLKSVDVGDTVTLHCFYKVTMSIHLSWYRQTLGDKPQLVSTLKFGQQSRLHNQFKDNPRFSVHCGENHLNISDVQPSDSAMYFCCESSENYGMMEFADGVFLNVKGSNTNEVVQQPVSESIQPGGSVTLNCTIHTETCPGEHSVYWFRHGSGESHPGILYTHGGKSDQCEKGPEAGSPTQSCVYNLHKRNLSLSDAGTYYCAVASCGKILFGNGTMLNIKGHIPDLPLLVYVLGAALGILFMLIVVLTCFVFKINRKQCPHCRVSRSVSQTTRSISPEYREGQDAENLHYAALNLKKKKTKPRRERDNVERDTVYSGVRD